MTLPDVITQNQSFILQLFPVGVALLQVQRIGSLYEFGVSGTPSPGVFAVFGPMAVQQIVAAGGVEKVLPRSSVSPTIEYSEVDDNTLLSGGPFVRSPFAAAGITVWVWCALKSLAGIVIPSKWHVICATLRKSLIPLV